MNDKKGQLELNSISKPTYADIELPNKKDTVFSWATNDGERREITLQNLLDKISNVSEKIEKMNARLDEVESPYIMTDKGPKKLNKYGEK